MPLQGSMLKGVVFVALAAGGGHSLALTDDGSVWAWGANGNGQLGNPEAGPVAWGPVPVLGSDGAGFTRLGSVGPC